MPYLTVKKEISWAVKLGTHSFAILFLAKHVGAVGLESFGQSYFS